MQIFRTNVKNKLLQRRDLSRKMRLEKCYTQMCLTSRKVPGKWLLRPKHFAFRILVPMSMLTFVNYRCVVIIVLQKIVEISLCSDNRFSENRPLLNIKETMKKNNNNNNNNNNNRVPGAAEGSKKLGSSNQPRHTQGREKRRPSTLMLWEKNIIRPMKNAKNIKHMKTIENGKSSFGKHSKNHAWASLMCF